jgi:hypothetical protein
MLPVIDTLHPTKSGAVCTALLVSLNGLGARSSYSEVRGKMVIIP